MTDDQRLIVALLDYIDLLKERGLGPKIIETGAAAPKPSAAPSGELDVIPRDLETGEPQLPNLELTTDLQLWMQEEEQDIRAMVDAGQLTAEEAQAALREITDSDIVIA